MKLSDIPLNPTPKVLRQFSAAWLVIVLGWGVFLYVKKGHHTAGLVLGALAVTLGPLGLAKPPAMRWIFVGAMVATFPLGWLVSHVMLAVMFYGIITPIAFFFRLTGRDALSRRPSPARGSYWIPKPTPQDLRSYFRQY